MDVSPTDGGRGALEYETRGDGPGDGRAEETKKECLERWSGEDQGHQQVPRVAQKEYEQNDEPRLRRGARGHW